MRGPLSQAIFLTAVLSTAAQAGGGLSLQPVQMAGEAIRFDRGDYVIDAVGPRAMVELHSATGENGDIAFELVVRNTGSAPINLDVSDVRVEGGGPGAHVLTRAELDHKAEHHAGWAKFWTKVGGSVVGTLEMNQRDYYHVHTTNGRSSWNTTVSAPCESCRADAYRTWAATGARVDRIQDGLDAKRASYRAQALQMTTVDPGQTYASIVALSHFKAEPMTPMRLVVSVGGDQFAFGFRFAPDGVPAPAYQIAALPVATPAPTVSLGWPRPSAPEPTVAPRIAPTPEPAPVPVRAIPVAYAPVRAPVASMGGRADAAVRGKWSRYYSALVADGVPHGQAKAMADQEVGSVD